METVVYRNPASNEKPVCCVYSRPAFLIGQNCRLRRQFEICHPASDRYKYYFPLRASCIYLPFAVPFSQLPSVGCP